jgi:hypothetical protein
MVAALERLAQLLEHEPKGAPAEDPGAPGRQRRFLADLGTNLWRLRQRMLAPGTTQPLDEMRRAYRHLEAAWDALTQAGVQVQDHTGSTIDPGMSLKVITSEPTPGLARDTVIETIKPSIYLKSERIQMGEVIVGTPPRSSGKVE